MRTYTLRKYQAEIILKTLRLFQSNNQAAIVAATGSGKTLMSQIVISKMDYPKVIIATPFLNIGKEFINKEDTQYISLYEKHGSNKYVVKKNSFKYVEDKKVKTISELLKSSGKHEPHIISHHALARLKNYLIDNENKNKIDYNNTLVVLDEAHHCSDNKEDKTNIGVVIKHICKNGGKVLYMTATPYRIFRNKPVSILPDDCHCSIKTTCALMREGYAPNIEVNYTVISQVDALQENGVGTFTNNGNTRFANKSAFIKCRDEIWGQYVKAGYPKSIVIIPQGDSATKSIEAQAFFESHKFPDDIASIRRRKHPKVLNAVGMGNKDDVLKAIKEDKDSNGQMYDIVIACKRCDEGTDIPSASHIFCVGIPGNIRLINQRMGRILRDKNNIVDYDRYFGTNFKETSYINYLVPCVNIKNFDTQGGTQLFHCLLVGGDYKKYCNDIPFVERIKFQVKQIIKNKPKTLDEEALDDKIDIALDDLTSNSEINKSSIEKSVLIELMKDSNLSNKLSELLTKLELDNKTEGITNLIDLIELPNDIKDELAKNFAKKLTDITLAPNAVVDDKIKELFDDIVIDFNKQHLKIEISKNVQKLVYKLTGKNIKYWCDTFYTSLEERLLNVIREVANNKSVYMNEID